MGRCPLELDASSSGFSSTAPSVVSRSAATEAAFCSADRVTLAGSMIPARRRSTHWPAAASKPIPSESVRIRSTITPPSWPAFLAMSAAGADKAVRTIVAPVASSPQSPRASGSIDSSARIRATPPPHTIPSSMAPEQDLEHDRREPELRDESEHQRGGECHGGHDHQVGERDLGHGTSPIQVRPVSAHGYTLPGWTPRMLL